MTIEQKRKILIRIAETEAEVDKLKEVRQEILTTGYASATVSSGGGSKSYTRLDIDKINKTIELLLSNLKSLKDLLYGRSKGQPSKIIQMYF